MNINEIENQFNERFLCSANPDIWLPHYKDPDNPNDEDREAPDPQEIKRFLCEAIQGVLEEVGAIYEKYKHLDGPLSDKEWAGANIGYSIACDLWQAVKGVVELQEKVK